jgi:hypothetical protein
MPFTGRLFAPLLRKKKGGRSPRPYKIPLSAKDVICAPATIK